VFLNIPTEEDMSFQKMKNSGKNGLKPLGKYKQAQISVLETFKE
jgi:hypothetical protein